MRISDGFTINYGNNITKVDVNEEYNAFKEAYNFLYDKWLDEDQKKIIDNRDKIIDSILDEEEK